MQWCELQGHLRSPRRDDHSVLQKLERGAVTAGDGVKWQQCTWRVTRKIIWDLLHRYVRWLLWSLKSLAGCVRRSNSTSVPRVETTMLSTCPLRLTAWRTNVVSAFSWLDLKTATSRLGSEQKTSTSFEQLPYTAIADRVSSGSEIS